jgi:hypothetical protein
VWAVAAPRNKTSTGGAQVRSLRALVDRVAERGLAVAVADVAGAKETKA